MKIGLEEVEKVSQLARIALNDDEKNKMATDMTNILDFVEKINELDTSNVEPTAHILDLKNVTREDVNKPSMPVDNVVKLAPKSKDNMVVVPKVI